MNDTDYTMLENIDHFLPDGHFNLDGVVERFVGKPPAELRTRDEIMAAFEAMSRPAYRAMGTDLLYSLWHQRRLNAELLRVLLLDVWRYTDFPRIGCPVSAWRAMFKVAGYLTGSIPKPKRRRVLYRGCQAKGRRGMSWTSERWIAEKFADYWFDLGQSESRGHVYKAMVAPSDILASIRGRTETKRFSDGTEHEVLKKPEFEFVVDARSIPIVMVETASARVRRIEREEARIARRFATAIEQEA
jgi:hypothetical protein